eukprot:Sspe_Gene.23023::Locus_8878_Transcript_1_1_Confidence_1.000_Length_1735::g.23023::m.23023/K04885/KCNB1; potassium voltage-gated channel Shab-related subfamily B member 1
MFPGECKEAPKTSPADEINVGKAWRQVAEKVADSQVILTLSEFRDLWKGIFPYRTPDEVARETNVIFNDLDALDEVPGELLLSYLDGEVIESGETFLGEAKTVREMVWVVCGSYLGHYTPTWLRHLAAARNLFTQVCILVSIVNMMVESLPSMQNPDESPGTPVTFAIEASCIGIFTVEFMMYLISYPKGPRKLASEPLVWVDLLVILPFYLVLANIIHPQDGPKSLVVLRMLRLLRLLRFVKLGRQSRGVMLLVVAMRRAQLMVWYMVLLVIVTMTVTSSFMFYAELQEARFDFERNAWMRNENSKYPDKGQAIAFQSIPATMWWSIVTLTTVGYGDMYPTTEWGKLVGGITMMAGLLVIGFPVTVLTSVFQEVCAEHEARRSWRKRREHVRTKLKKYLSGVVDEGDRPLEVRAQSFLDNLRRSVDNPATDTAEPPSWPTPDPPPRPANIQIAPDLNISVSYKGDGLPVTVHFRSTRSGMVWEPASVQVLHTVQEEDARPFTLSLTHTPSM